MTVEKKKRSEGTNKNNNDEEGSKDEEDTNEHDDRSDNTALTGLTLMQDHLPLKCIITTDGTTLARDNIPTPKSNGTGTVIELGNLVREMEVNAMTEGNRDEDTVMSGLTLGDGSIEPPDKDESQNQNEANEDDETVVSGLTIENDTGHDETNGKPTEPNFQQGGVN